jgi:hypothetical protein
MLLGIGDAAPAAAGALGEADEIDASGDLDPRSRSDPGAATGSHAAGPHGHVIDLPTSMIPDTGGPSVTRGEGGLGRNPRLPEHLAANPEARRLPAADPKGHAVPGSPSNPSVQGTARTLEAPLQAVVIPGHPNFTQLTNGHPSAATPRFVAGSARTP